MQQHAEQIVDLLDNQQRRIGQMRIERQEENLLIGTFVPGPAFPSVESLFRAFEEAADVQALSVIDELDTAIAALGLHLRSPGAPEPMAIQDVQIWSDGGISCRLCSPPAASANAKRQSLPRRHTMEATDRLTKRCGGRGTQPPRR